MNSYSNIKEIGKRIRTARKTKGLTQEQLSEMIDMSTNNLSYLECGNTGLSVPALIAICESLEVSSDYILFGARAKESNSPVISLFSKLNEEQQHVAEQLVAVYANSCKR